MMNGKATLAVMVLSLSAIGFSVWDLATRSDDAPKAQAAQEAPSPEPAKAQAAPSVAEVTLQADRVVAATWRAPARAKAPCVARDEGKRDLVQGSGTVRTYTFCK